ncbi:hypothetical protein SAMN05660337_1760 [Maridesulfovibrio ferrireducens]|uniref:EF-hand domain-containing protein n=1 Tax=Maridesulfovibrio ferrireducens TaxID=246191 RepID=A0A1G9FYR2_9BACT|nr:hypothetical protein [Maridesulfovibrio ferrireducens]SDK93455.1 hypothetical protein SAMN05660337_1760 [Maridesulfovibrio ferrireducens]
MTLRRLSIFFMIFAGLILCAAPSAMAQEKSFTIINHTGSVVRVWGKSNDFEFGRVKASTITDCSCNALYNKDCFDKKGGKAKIKLAREDKNGVDLWSGDTCVKLYIAPGTNIDVTLAADGRHIKCEIVKDYEIKKPLPTFEEADLNKDGKIDEEEAEAIQLKANFKDFDSDLNNELNPSEFDNAVNKFNIFRGVPF